jgi:Peptidase A4 family
LTSRRLVLLCLAGIGALVFGAGSALAADGGTQSSSNWAGYAVTDSGTAAATGAAPTTFSNVSGSWTQPAATCTSGSQTYAAFWVGIGGFTDGSQALEQIGTQANCSANGRASYSVWYELVPAAPVTIKLKLVPGDSLSAGVGVTGSTVSLRIANTTRNTVFTRTLTMATPDITSAEWVAEAPSTCNGGSCRPLPLANFGTATFASASVTGNGHAGTISDPAWTETAVNLQGTSAGLFRSRFAAALPTADATAGALSSNGGSFAVSWSQEAAAAPGSTYPYGRGGGWGR